MFNSLDKIYSYARYILEQTRIHAFAKSTARYCRSIAVNNQPDRRFIAQGNRRDGLAR